MGSCDGAEWRDWANLGTELIEDITGRLLALDLTEYIRFRAACKPWRDCTDDPRARCGMDSHFRPRDWIALPHCASPSRRVLLNVATGARADVDFPELNTHHHFGAADGLLVLCHKATNAVRLLNPLTGMLTEFPAITNVRAVEPPHSAVLRALRSSEPDTILLDALKIHVPDPSAIDGVGIDDSTSPPTLLLCLRKGLWNIVCAKPGDQHWVSVHYGEQRVTPHNALGKILFHSLISLGGRCYVAMPDGDIMAVDPGPTTGPLCRTPRMVYLIRETPRMVHSDRTGVFSYLVRSQDRMLMVRYFYSPHLANGGGPGGFGYKPTETFMSHGCPSRMELFEVDLAGRQLIPLSGIGDRAVFVGQTHTVMISTEKFPKIAANAVYLNYYLQRRRRFGIYHFENGTTTPARELRHRQDGDGRFSPCACHWELDDYLICDVQQAYNSAQINTC